MSNMELTKKVDERLSESRAIIRESMAMAYGSYVEQEAKKFDQWRDQTWWQLVQHTRHEIEELQRSGGFKTKQLHNALDLCSLGAIMASKIILEEAMIVGEVKWMKCEKCGQEMERVKIVDQIGDLPITYSYMDVCRKCEIIKEIK